MHQNLLRNLFAVFLFAGAAWAQVTVLPVTLPLAEQGAPYNVAFSASGGLAPYTFSVIQGNLPAGLTLSSAGVLSGTPTQAGTFGIVVQAVASGGTGSGDRSYTLFVVDASCPDPNAFVGVTYGSLFSSEPSPSFYSPAGGTFPPGLDVNADGFVSGTPTTAGSFTFGVNLDFGSAGVFVKTCTIHVNSQLGSMAPFSVARLGVPYRSGVTAYGGTAPFSFALQSGSLPPGLALNSSNGQITGTPTGAGLSTFTVLISDNNGRTFNPTYTINVLSRPEPAASLRCPAPTGVGGFSYLSQVSINSGSVQSFAITQGQLPPGVTLDSATGIISGPLTLGVNASFRVSANLGSSTAFADCNITTDLQFPEASPAGLCADQYDFQLGEAVHFRVPSTGSRRPISTQLYQTQLPPGFTLDPHANQRRKHLDCISIRGQLRLFLDDAPVRIFHELPALELHHGKRTERRSRAGLQHTIASQRRFAALRVFRFHHGAARHLWRSSAWPDLDAGRVAERHTHDARNISFPGCTPGFAIPDHLPQFLDYRFRARPIALFRLAAAAGHGKRCL
jgi:hypothetical protein